MAAPDPHLSGGRGASAEAEHAPYLIGVLGVTSAEVG